MASTSAQMRRDIGKGAPVMVISGQIHHALYNITNSNAQLESLFFLDAGEADERRSNNMLGDKCNRKLLMEIDALLKTTHPYARMYRTLGQVVEQEKKK